MGRLAAPRHGEDAEVTQARGFSTALSAAEFEHSCDKGGPKKSNPMIVCSGKLNSVRHEGALETD
eukprot:3711871-Amphidinium_carterae.1